MIFAASTELPIPNWLIEGLILVVVAGVLALVFRSLLKSFQTWVAEWFERVSTKQEDTLKEIKENGGDSPSTGDRTKRIEENSVELRADLIALVAKLNSSMQIQSTLVWTLSQHVKAFDKHVLDDERLQKRMMVELKRLNPEVSDEA